MPPVTSGRAARWRRKHLAILMVSAPKSRSPASRNSVSTGASRLTLSGGNPRSLSDIDEVIEAALDDSARLEELFCCLFCDDPIVRMRAADGLEKIAGQRLELVVPYLERLLGKVATIEQPSVQWHLAQILAEVPLDPDQRQRAIKVLKRNLERSEDWIVLTVTMESLALFAKDDAKLRRWLLPVRRRRLADERKAVVKRAGKPLKGLEPA